MERGLANNIVSIGSLSSHRSCAFLPSCELKPAGRKPGVIRVRGSHLCVRTDCHQRHFNRVCILGYLLDLSRSEYLAEPLAIKRLLLARELKPIVLAVAGF